MKTRYFDFRIIVCSDGTEIIDRRVKTAYKALSSKQMIEYAWLEMELEILDKQKLKARAEDESRRKIKIARNPLLWVVCAYGVVCMKGKG